MKSFKTTSALTVHIPIHDFRTDDNSSVPFRFIPLDTGSGYDIYEPHRHNYYEIFFFRTGGGTHTIDFNEIPIRERSIHFISPGQVHLMRRSPEAVGSIVLFSREFYYCQGSQTEELYTFPFLHNNTVTPVMEVSEEEFHLFQTLLDQVKLEERSHDPGILKAYLQVILIKCKALFDTKIPEGNHPDKELFMRFRTLVEKDYRVKRQPAIYAHELFITEKKLNNLCKTHSGTSAGDFIRDRVLLEAKRLLHNADHTVKEIGYFLGFEDPSYFNRFFKANTGVTAISFRNGQTQPPETER